MLWTVPITFPLPSLIIEPTPSSAVKKVPTPVTAVDPVVAVIVPVRGMTLLLGPVTIGTMDETVGGVVSNKKPVTTTGVPAFPAMSLPENVTVYVEPLTKAGLLVSV
jgi:hypothetical protein